MRFAYIDSQGNEVPIPSIDALALRIQLGAVGPDTELYDAQADQWGPAHTHEIFHSLSRDADEEGFMAPPPPVAAAPPTASPPVSVPASEAPKAELASAEKADDQGFDLGLTLAAPPPELEGEDSAASLDEGGFGDIAFDMAPPPEAPEKGGGLSGAGSPSPEADGGFDFGDLGSGLELEGPDEEPAGGDIAGGMELETKIEFGSPAADFAGGGDSLKLEQPMSAFEPDSPPGWSEESRSDDVMDFSAVAAEEEAGQEPVEPVTDVPTRERRSSKDRPSAPKFKRQRSMSGPIVSVVLLMALGVGGYVGWPMVSDMLGDRSAPERPAVVMPIISEELIPQMRSLAASAIASVVSEVSEATRVADAGIGPHDDWLGGAYLGNASQYTGIEAFWSSIDELMNGMRAADWQVYHDKFVELVEQDGVAAEAARQITERADSGFVAAQAQRSQAYTEMETLVGAALDLHDFLLRNEAAIEFRPGVASTTDPNVDPVLEISASGDLRAQMLEMFDDITSALDRLGSLDRVTRDRLVEALRARLQQVGIQ